MIQIIPSILVPSEKDFLEQVESVEDILSIIQIDIADGKFVPNTTWSYSDEAPEIVTENLNIDCELHLMVEDPLAVVRKWTDVSQVKRVLVHYESNPEEIAEILAQIHSYGWEVSVVLNPDTLIDVVEDFIEEIDGIMFMGVKPGFQGQEFVPEVLDKIKTFNKKYPNHFVEIDGAVNEDTLPGLIEAGVDGICPGSSIFGNDREPKENVKRIKELINTLTKKS